MTKADIIKRLKDEAGLPNNASAEAAFDTLFSILKSELASGERVSVMGFGTFSVTERAERKGRNPRTGKEVVIPARKAVKFTAGKGLKDSVK